LIPRRRTRPAIVRPVHGEAGVDILDTPAAGAAAIRGGILRITGYAAGVALSVVAAALLIRHLGPADFGRYTAVISLVTILAAIAEAGLTSLGVREHSVLPPGRRGELVSELVGLRLVTTAAGVAISVAFAAFVGYDREMVVGVLIAGLGMLLFGLQASYAIPLQSRLRLGWVTALELIRQAVLLLAVAALVAANASLVPFFWATVVSSLAALLVVMPLVRGLLPLVPRFRTTDWRRLLALTVPFATANALGAVYVYLIVVVLSLTATEQETGYFGASFRVFIVISAVPGLLVASAFPILARAARDDTNRLAYGLQRLWEMMLLLGVGAALCTALGAELAIDVVAGSDFEPSVEVLEVQALALLPSFLLAVWGFALLSLALYRALIVVNAVALGVSLGVALVLGERYGANGAAWATVFGETALAAGCALALFWHRPDLRPDLAIIPRVGAALLLALSPLLVPGVTREVEFVLAAVVYAVAAFLLRAIPDEIGHALRPGRGQ
jgi:O-antigen/teichoic acid export membrane protein